PTHAAEAAVPVDCRAARANLAAAARRLDTHSRRAITDRARTLERLAAAPGHPVARERRRLHQLVPALRATARRRGAAGRPAAAAAGPADCRAARANLAAAARRLDTHSRRAITDRARTLERLAAAPGHHVARERRRLHQLVRELRASARRGVEAGRQRAAVHA